MAADVRWLGHSAFHLSGGGADVLIDPFLTGNPKAPVSAEDIIAWCREHLARFKVPRTVVFGELPKTSTGKIQKFVLRGRAREI